MPHSHLHSLPHGAFLHANSWSTDLHGNEYILVEFMHFGSLDKCLANFGPSLRNRSKLLMCEQICHAMCELASEGVLHRDLAARNILVQSMQPVHVKVEGNEETNTGALECQAAVIANGVRLQDALFALQSLGYQLTRLAMRLPTL